MELFKIAKQRDRQGKDVHQARVIKNEDGEVLVEKQKVKQRWKEYFDNLLNQENPRERREIRTDGTERIVDKISVAEVRTAMRRMMKGKALGLDKIPVEAWLCLGNRGVEFLTSYLINCYMGERCQTSGGRVCWYHSTREKVI